MSPQQAPQVRSATPARTERQFWKQRALSHEDRILALALASGLPAMLLSVYLLYANNYSPKVIWTFGLLVVGSWLGFAFNARERVVGPLRTLANLLEAMREGDYSLRASASREGDALGEVFEQVNAIGNVLHDQRLGALEATTLLRKVMEEIEVAVFAFDAEQRLRLVNKSAERLLAQPSERLLGRTAEAIGLREFIEGTEARVLSHSFPGGTGRWGIRRSQFRGGGLPLTLLVLADLTRALRQEELQAWQRLVRVLGHELNNSLTPIKSIAGSLESLLMRDPRPEDWQEDMQRGLSIIGSRSEALSRFMGAYAHLAKLPPPRFAPVITAAWINRVAQLETRMTVRVEAGPDYILQGDSDQLEQLLINLVRNAVDASLETNGCVTLTWQLTGTQLEVKVLDEGRGLANTNNLFVPFFTTKPHGSGIGLVLSRQIAEAHGGSLTLENRLDRTGCEARLMLPA